MSSKKLQLPVPKLKMEYAIYFVVNTSLQLPVPKSETLFLNSIKDYLKITKVNLSSTSLHGYQ